MKTKKLIRVLFVSWLVVFMAFVGVFAAGCKDKTDYTEGNGEYYYDSDSGTEYTLTLNDGAFTYVTSGTRSGTYTFADSTYTFTFSKNDTMIGVLSGATMTVTYNDSSMLFYKKVDYTVTFDSKGGSSVSSMTVVNGKTATKPSDPTRDGYTFIGWYTDSSYTTSFGFGTDKVTSDITLYARWVEIQEEEFTVSFDLNYEGAETLSSLTTSSGQIFANEVTTPARSGYTFLGWWVSMYNDADKISYQWTEDVVFEEDVTLYALWSDNSASLSAPVVNIGSSAITWDGITGASSYNIVITGPDSAQIVSASTGSTTYAFNFSSYDAGDYIVEVTAVSSSAQSETTARYYRNKALARVSHFTVTDNVLSFNAVSNATEYFISYECGDSTHDHAMLSLGTSTYYDFSACEMPSGGFTFVITASASGYASSASKEYVLTRTISAVSPSYDSDSDVVTWEAVENAESYVVTITAGSTTTTFDNGTKTSVSLASYTGSISVSVYARGTGYAASATATVSVTKSALATPADIKIVGYTLTWSAVEGATGYTIQIGSQTYTATGTSYDLSSISWSETTYTLKIKATGSTDSYWSEEFDLRYLALASSITYSEGVVNWNYVVGADYYEVKVNDGEAVQITDGSNYYAVTLTQTGTNTISVRFVDGSTASEWVSTTVTAYSITFDSQEGSAVDTIYLATGDPVNLPESVRGGYALVGWYLGSSSNSALYNEAYYTGTENLKLYARWAGRDYTVTYVVGDGGAMTDSTATVTYNSAYTLEVPESNDALIGFAGWYSGENGTGTKYTNDLGVSVSNWSDFDDVTLYAYWVEVFKITTSGSTATISRGSQIAYVTTVTVPATYTVGDATYTVTEIASDTFSSCANLTQINIPDTVQTLYANTFRTCTNLQAINVYEVEGNNVVVYSSDNGVLFYQNAESSNELQLVYYPMAKTDATYSVPEGTNVVLQDAFYINNYLTEVTLPTTITQLYTEAFYSCTALTSVTFTEGGSSSLTISQGAFNNCTLLSSVTFPSRLSTLYYGTSETSFVNCTSLAEINVADGGSTYASSDGMLMNADKTQILYCPLYKTGELAIPTSVTEVSESAFYGRTLITSVVITSQVTKVGAYAFYGCTRVTTVTFDGTQTALTVGDYAFAGCTALTKVVIGAASDGSVTFGDSVFENCTALASVELSAYVTSFDNGVFAGCTALNSIVVAEGNPEFASVDGVLYNAGKTTIVYVPVSLSGDIEIADTVTSIGKNAFQNRTLITSLTFGSGLATILEHAFDGCTSLASVTFTGTGELSIGNYAFYGCTALTTVTFASGTGKVTIGGYAFAEGGLKSVNLESTGVTTIGEYAFYETALTSVSFPATITNIGEGAFMVAEGADSNTLTSVTFAKNTGTLYIGAQAFRYGQFTSVNLEDTGVVSIGSEAFRNCTLLESLHLPSTLTTVGTYAFAQAFSLIEGTGTVVFDNSATSLTFQTDSGNSYAFYGTTKLTSVTLPEGLTAIPAQLFSGMSSILQPGLTSINIPSTVTSVALNAFYYCSSLTTITFAEDGTSELTIEDGTSTTSIVSGSKNLETVSLPSRLTSIPAYLFYNQTKLASVAIESGFSGSIGDYAFYGTAINSISLDGVTTIGENAFANNKGSLASVTLGSEVSSVVTATNSSFDRAVSFTVESGNSTYTAANGALYTNSGATLVWVPTTVTGTVSLENVTTIGDYALYQCTKVTAVSNYSSVATIGEYAFAESGVTGFEITSAMTSIATTAFNNCTSLASLTLSADFDFTLINTYFYSCTALSSFKVGNETYTGILYDDNKTTIYYVCATVEGEVEIPATVTAISDSIFYGKTGITKITFADNAVCTTIGANAFEGCTLLESVSIPGSVTSIGASAFKDCTALTTVTFEAGGMENVTFGATSASDAVFSGTALTTLTLPARMTTIPAYAFYGAEKLLSVTFESGTTAVAVGEHAFFGCTSLATIDFSLFTEIGDFAFAVCSALTSVTFGEGLTSLGEGAFLYCAALTTVDLSKATGVTIADGIATYTSTVGYDLSYTVTTGEGDDQVTSTYHYTNYNYSRSYTGAFADCFALTSVTLPSGITSIARYMFARSGLTSFTIPATVTQVGFGAFYACVSLTEVTATATDDGSELLIEGATGGNSIDVGVFEECIGLVTVDFSGRNVTEIGTKAFYTILREGTTSLTTVKLSDTYSISIGTQAFQQQISLTTINLGKATSILEYAFRYCSSLATVDLSSASAINAYAFASSGITSVATSSALTTLGDYVFSGCGSLTEVDLSASTALTAIPDYAFYGVSGVSLGGEDESGEVTISTFNSISLPSSITSIGNYAFSGCSYLASFTFPAAVTSIGNYAFNNCSSLTALDFDSVSSSFTIGDYAFTGTGFTTVTLPKNVSEYGEGVFANCTSLTTVELNGETTVGASMFENCTALVTVNDIGTLTNIGASAFAGCTALTTLYLDAIINIGANAFENCTGVTTLVLGEDCTTIGNEAFLGCENMSFVYNLSSKLSLTTGSTANGYAAYYASVIFTSGYPSESGTTTTTTADGFVFTEGTDAWYLVDYTGTSTSITLPTSAPVADGEEAQTYVVAARSFYGNTTITSVTITGGVTAIENSAFANCTALTTVTLSGSDLTTIGEYAFSGCTALTTVDVSSVATTAGLTIEDYAFENTAITSFTIPASLVAMGSSAFSGCNVSFTIAEGNTAIGATEEGIIYFTSGSILYIPTNITKVVIPAAVTAIGDNQFDGYTTITSLEFEEGSKCTSIGNYAFYGCTNLTGTITLPSALESVGVAAFVGTKITEVVFTGTATEIVAGGVSTTGAFSNVTTLTKVTATGVTKLGAYTFYGCTALESADLSDVVTVEKEAFRNCTALVSVMYGSVLASFSSQTFQGTTISAIYYGGTIDDWVSNITFVNGQYVTGLYTATLYVTDGNGGYVEATDITITAEAVNDYALYYYTNLTKVTFDTSVTSIGKSALYYYSSTSGVTNLVGVYYNGTADQWASISFADANANGLNNAKYLYLSDGNGGYELATDITLSVETISAYAFYYCYSLVRVTLESTVTTIGTSAFQYCQKLVEVYNKTGITLETGKNYGYVISYAKNVYTSDGGSSNIITQGDYIFYNDSETYYLIGYAGRATELELPTLMIEETATNYSIYQYAFYFNKAITSVVIPSGVTTIGNYAFQYCTSLTSVVIGDDVETVGTSVFGYCSSLESVSIGSSVTSIGNTAFQYCTSLTTVYYNGTVDEWASNITFSAATSTGLYYGATLYVKNGETYEAVADITLNVTTVNKYAFAYYVPLNSVIFGKNVTTIDTSAFQNCTSLTYVTLGANVATINSAAFQNCYKLIIIYNNSSLSLTIGGTTNGYIAYYAMTIITADSAENTEVFTHGDYMYFYDGETYYLISYLGSETELTMPTLTIEGDETNYAIGQYAFYGNTTLTSVTIGSNVTEIGAYAFRKCTALVSISVDCATIGTYAFADDTALLNITFGDNVETIGTYAFYNCIVLKSVTISDSVATIGTFAFSSCTKLEIVVIGSGVTNIGASAFLSSEAIIAVYYNGTEDKWNEISFADTLSDPSYYDDATIYYYAEKDSTTVAGNYWYYDTDGATIVTWTVEETTDTETE